MMARYEPRDKFYRKAREKGLPSRAAFKLAELLGRLKLPRHGLRAIDLGCAPGGWLVILGRAAGPQGRIVGIDLVPCGDFGPSVVTLVGDVRDPAIAALALEKLGGPANLITSDLAPKLTGIAERDEAGLAELIEAALAIARRTLKPGGAMIAKLFMGAAFKATLARFEESFDSVATARVRATRPGSAELYVIAQGFRG